MRFKYSVFLVVSALLFGSAPAVANAQRLVDVVFITWPGARVIGPSLQEVRSVLETDVRSDWQRFTSFDGSELSKTVNFEYGTSLSSPLVLTRPMTCDGDTASSFMNSIRQEFYQRLGISNFASRYLLIVSPDAGCLWLGRALVGGFNAGGVITLQNNARPFVIIHELGHTLGLGHTNLLRCNSGLRDGPWGSDCKAIEYGGTIDVMGNIPTKSPLSTYHLWRMGLLENSEVRESWLSETIELSAADVAGPIRSIFFRDGTSSYWLEYRRASIENSYKAGLVLYRTDPPPGNAIVSINPEDVFSTSTDTRVATDIWMLNLGDYSYTVSPTRASGSMTLSSGSLTRTFTGKISISSEPSTSDRSVIVKINRQADITPPPKPLLSEQTSWRFPESSLISPDYEDKDSKIEKFEIKINNDVKEITAGSSSQWIPTYLNPLSPSKTVLVKDLPEGSYSFQLRGIDIWGNVSEWSDPARVVIDRGFPIMTEDWDIESISQSTVTISFPTIQDKGSGICESVLASPQGWILSRDTAKFSPTFTLNTESPARGNLRVFDCNGNGLSRDYDFSARNVMADKTKRTGSWTAASKAYPQGSLRCKGKCTASISLAGDQSILVGSGTGEIVANKQLLGKIESKSQEDARVGSKISLGAKKRVVRIVGRDLVLIGFTDLQLKLSPGRNLALMQTFPDPSLDNNDQKLLANFGFKSSDFTDQWTVLPMPRGTTLLDPTLDLCDAEFKSESERESRRQIQITGAGATYSFLSSEVVRYRSSEAVNQALSELKDALSECISNNGGSNSAGIKVPYKFGKVPSSSLSFVPEGNRVFVRALIGSGDSARWLLGFYQFEGKFFTGLYVVKSGSQDFTNEEIKVWLNAASTLGQRLLSPVS